MKKLLFLICFCVCNSILAQSNFGLETDNYGGLHHTIKNPANSADSRSKIDVNLYSASVLLATDYTNLTLDNVNTIINGESFESLERFPSSNNEILANVDFLGPSFMFSLGEQRSMGLINRIRVMGNFNNIDGELFESVYDGFPANDFDFEQSNLDFTIHAWYEIGLHYSQVFLSESKNIFLKGGVTMKYLLGGGAAQGSSNALRGNYQTAGDQVNLNGDFAYTITYDEDQESESIFSEMTPGFGMDLGLVYEYRTTESQAAANTDNIRAFNKYKLKIGLAVTDIGAINYKDVETTNYIIDGTVSSQDLESDFTTTLEDNFVSNSTRNDIKVSLPTNLNLNLDYHLNKKFYLNLDLNQSLVKKDKFYNNNRLNLVTLTPRYESRFLGAYLPISYSSLGNTAFGFGLRLGPLIVGSGTIISNLTSKKAQAANVYVGLKIPIYHKKKKKSKK
jgi:hypothetical protein